ncbi:MAG: peptide chain release factor N(5)-glutamine methyltransferase [Burkholderiaceae bacterium]|nr:peptide chain release factor N(5)-glutamine methyltransferase [Burkholderiaceae bacterium]
MQTGQSLLQLCGLPRLEARMLLECVLHKPREWLLAHDTDPIAPEEAAKFLTLAAQRRQGVPMAHLIGWREFMGHRFEVTPVVLIPRPETELLVEVALASLDGCMAPSVLDMGTGSGIVAISLALARPDARVTATDLSVEALSVAQRNAQALTAHIQWWQGSWFEALPQEGRFQLIVSNPPYIAAQDAHLQRGDLRFEPALALTDGADGLSALAQIISGAGLHLLPGGYLWLEHGYDQAEAVGLMLERAGFTTVQTHTDLANLPRVTGGVWK